MVKIVGKDDRAVHRCTCPHCASILEYTLNEVNDRRYSSMGEMGTVYYIMCPNGHEVIVRQT
jgi:hypothetical protein